MCSADPVLIEHCDPRILEGHAEAFLTLPQGFFCSLTLAHVAKYSLQTPIGQPSAHDLATKIRAVLPSELSFVSDCSARVHSIPFVSHSRHFLRRYDIADR